MALINCPECQRQVSDSASACPQCGYLITNPNSRLPAKAPTPSPPFRLPTSDAEWEEVKGALFLAAIIVALPAAGAWYLTKVSGVAIAGGVAGFVGCMMISPLRRRLLQAGAAFLLLALVVGALILIVYFLGH